MRIEFFQLQQSRHRHGSPCAGARRRSGGVPARAPSADPELHARRDGGALWASLSQSHQLDVDGIEHAILLGAARALAQPTLRSIIVESEETRPGADSIHSLLRAAGFELE